MRIYLTDSNKVMNVELRIWEHQQYSPDLFADLACQLRTDYPISEADAVEHDAACAMTEAEYAEEMNWWSIEVERFNRHEDSWFTESCDDPEAEWAKEYEYYLFSEEVTA